MNLDVFLVNKIVNALIKSRTGGDLLEHLDKIRDLGVVEIRLEPENGPIELVLTETDSDKCLPSGVTSDYLIACYVDQVGDVWGLWLVNWNLSNDLWDEDVRKLIDQYSFKITLCNENTETCFTLVDIENE